MRSLKVLGGALIATALLTLGPVAAWAAQTDAKDGYQPVRPGELVERLPATPLVFGAYAIVWVVVTVYVLTLWRRISKAEREIAEIASKLEGKAG